MEDRERSAAVRSVPTDDWVDVLRPPGSARIFQHDSSSSGMAVRNRAAALSDTFTANLLGHGAAVAQACVRAVHYQRRLGIDNRRALLEVSSAAFIAIRRTAAGNRTRLPPPYRLRPGDS